MTTNSDDGDDNKKLKLKKPGKLELSKTVEQGQVKQSFSHGRSKQVSVEVKRKRTYQRGESGRMTEVQQGSGQQEAEKAFQQPTGQQAPSGQRQQPAQAKSQPQQPAESRSTPEEQATRTLEREQQRTGRTLTESERQARLRALEQAERDREERERKRQEEEERRRRQAEEEAQRREEEEKRRQAEEEARKQLEAEEAERQRQKEAEEAAQQTPQDTGADAPAAADSQPAAEAEPEAAPVPESEETADARAKRKAKEARDKDDAAAEEAGGRVKRAKGGEKKPGGGGRNKGGDDRRRGRLTISQALEGGEGNRSRSQAQLKRQRQRQKQQQSQQPPKKVVREVQIPDVITVGELANRMAERSGDVIKQLMQLGTMATINQSIDPETAELIVQEFGHTPKRVSDADVEDVLHTEEDREEDLKPRAPVVTVMGHVDHGKTSLLDALRKTDVVAGEAGGITQHIGAYQVVLSGGAGITFLDTPGHAAFTQMRSRGADVTDIVVLVVAADDSVKDQTVEAINHAKAAEKPIVVAINKCDKPEANPDKVRQELLNYEIVTEDMGGETQAIEVSATTREGLDQLEEAILLQAEILELKANPDRAAEGVVVEAKLEKGRGPVATILVQRGTLKKGDNFVAGAEWGRVRALVNDRGENVNSAGPSIPVELLGLQGTPKAGDEVIVVDNEQRAREISEYRQERQREKEVAASGRASLETMLSQIKEGQASELPVVIKADVQGSLEAIQGALGQIGNDEVQPNILHHGVGGINESDVTLAGASGAVIIAFNVRANGKAREMAKQEGVNIRYYSVIYNLIDDVKQALQGMLSPEAREEFIGYAEIRQVFSVTKVGKVAGCRVTEGVVKRGAGVRLLRDNRVIYEGNLKTLKRFKDEVREVKDGYECGISLENWEDIQEGDVLECYEVKEVQRTL
ncbi:translation initiation factor IF-2 [Rhodovibrio salinarum]|nr:translation initiation factor IF-2 [Rhodovibrio salinarum]